MKNILIASLSLLTLLSCERVVDVQDPVPEEVVYCFADEVLIGDWRTDSVWIITEVDTLDSLIENRQPGFFYDLSVNCGDQKELLLTYTGFHNLTTVDVRSTNYESSDSTLFAYDQFEDQQDTSKASFRMPFTIVNDTLMNCTLKQDLGNGQLSTYFLFFKSI